MSSFFIGDKLNSFVQDYVIDEIKKTIEENEITISRFQIYEREIYEFFANHNNDTYYFYFCFTNHAYVRISKNEQTIKIISQDCKNFEDFKQFVKKFNESFKK